MPRLARAAFVLLCFAAISAAAQSRMHKVDPLPPDSLASLQWASLTSDPKGDGLQGRLPDASGLSYAIDAKSDVIWLKVTVYDPLPERWIGMSAAVDIDGNPDNGMVWWGTNKAKFDRLASAFLFKGEGYWQGYAGVGDSDSVGAADTTNLTRDVPVALDREQRAVLLGIPRWTLGTAPAVRVLATVGSMVANNDDVPNEGMVTIRLEGHAASSLPVAAPFTRASLSLPEHSPRARAPLRPAAASGLSSANSTYRLRRPAHGLERRFSSDGRSAAEITVKRSMMLAHALCLWPMRDADSCSGGRALRGVSRDDGRGAPAAGADGDRGPA
jgi:hypothetical protein